MSESSRPPQDLRVVGDGKPTAHAVVGDTPEWFVALPDYSNPLWRHTISEGCGRSPESDPVDTPAGEPADPSREWATAEAQRIGREWADRAFASVDGYTYPGADLPDWEYGEAA